MAQDFEKGMEVADVYAAALCALAAEAGRLDAVGEELAELVRVGEQNPAFAAFVSSIAVDMDERAKSLERLFRGRLSDVVLDTLQVMNRHGRLELLHALHGAYVRRMEDARGQIEVVATSAVELDAQQKAEVLRLAERLSGLKPLVAHVVDPGVLGGLVLQIGDQRYDNSLRRHLRVARDRLLERNVRGAAAAGLSGPEA
jgi:F-type H+-transporting ATPase subunit delta